MFKTELSFNLDEQQLNTMEATQLSTEQFTFNDLDSYTITEILQDETTMDVANAVIFESARREFVPISTFGPPVKTEWSGDYNFSIEINAKDTHKKKYLYSQRLHRIYVNMKCNFSLQFNWNYTMCSRPMFVRATTVFSDESQAEKRVERCVQHTYETTPKPLAENVIKNVLHSARDVGTEGVYYCGDPNRADSWYSVLVAFPCNTPPPYSHAYQFVCKNSCSNGINRRSIEIIFTLEDDLGTVYGRQVVGARACACPKRDMVRDQDAALPKSGKKRCAEGNPPISQDPPNQPKAKIVKIEVRPDSDDEDFELVKFSSRFGEGTCGISGFAAGLQVMVHMLEERTTSKHKPKHIEKLNSFIADLKGQLAIIKEEKS